MQKSLTLVFQVLTAGVVLLGIASARQTPAATTQPAAGQTTSSQSTAPAKSSSSAATTKSSSTTTKKTTGTAAKTAAAPVVLKTDKDKQSYAMGMNLGTGLHRNGMTLDPALVARGLKDAQSGGKTAMTDDEVRTTMGQLQNEIKQKMQAKAQELGEKNKKEGEEFLAANKTKDGVVTLPSGLQYKVLTEGTGPKPTSSDTVTCNYRGTLINGTEFDSSYKRNEPASFPVTGVIKGWTEALQLMPVGSKWQLFIPSDMAYGDSGRPGIEPGSTLVFEVELLSIGEQKKGDGK
jgi:FKBP-type peptidyl-prolyl cis-trans isomerase FklB